MMRHGATIFALFAQVLAMVAPHTVVRCVHDDGSSAIEFAGALCCGDGPSDALQCSADPHRTETQINVDDDHCTDYALEDAEIRPTAVQQHLDYIGVMPAIPALAPHEIACWSWTPGGPVLPSQCGPPGTRPPHLKSIVLLC